MSNETYIDFPDAAAQIATPQPSDLIPVYRPAALEGDPAAVTGLASATMQQLGELAGLDHSKLEEQAVPGEFWLDKDGARKQVYTKTAVIKFPNGYKPDASHINIIANVVAGISYTTALVDWSGYRIDNDYYSSASSTMVDIRQICTLIGRGAGWGRIFVLTATAAYSIPCTIILTIKYTKD